MGFMNGFVEKEFVNMRRFIDDISVNFKFFVSMADFKKKENL